MKHTKKLAAILLSLAMVLITAMPAFAQGTLYSITIENETPGHIYEAYQIFAGDMASDDELYSIQYCLGQRSKRRRAVDRVADGRRRQIRRPDHRGGNCGSNRNLISRGRRVRDHSGETSHGN